MWANYLYFKPLKHTFHYNQSETWKRYIEGKKFAKNSAEYQKNQIAHKKILLQKLWRDIFKYSCPIYVA